MEQTKICIRCKVEQPSYAFYKGKTLDGLRPHCKDCEKEYYKRKYKGEKYETMDAMFRPTKEDYFFYYRIMSILGYDINKDIHQQFCEKHSLKYKKRPARHETKYFPSDFDFSSS